MRAQKRLYYQRHKERVRQTLNPANLARARQLRQAVLSELGGACVRCGFDDWRALQIDHINGGGRKDRARFLNTSQFLNAVLATSGVYQLLCANCNWVKRYEKQEYRWRKALPTTGAVTEP